MRIFEKKFTLSLAIFAIITLFVLASYRESLQKYFLSLSGVSMQAPVDILPPVSPSPKMQNLINSELSFSILYPETYLVQTDEFMNQKSVAVYTFLPRDVSKRETDIITLRILKRNSAQSLDDWMKINATSYKNGDAQITGKTYLLENVSNIASSSATGKPIATFIQTYPDTLTRTETTALLSSKYVYLLIHNQDVNQNLYREMLASLTV